MLDSETLGTENEHVLLILLKSHYCPDSRELVRALRDADERFRDRSTTVVPVLPDSRDRAAVWDERYDVPFPLLADPGEGDGFDALSGVRSELSELPGAALLERTEDGTLVVVDRWVVDGESAGEPTSVQAVLERLDDYRRDEGCANPEP